ncbi:MAG: enoyl-CoA hydratase [Microthrixaceae bacterium]
MPQILIERHDRVAVLTLNDPSHRNALNLDLNEELIAAVDALENDEAVGAIVVTGAAPAFCAGADLSQLGESRREGLSNIYRGFLRVADSTLPTIAAVNGAAVGAGMNLALACDLRIASRSARFDTRFLDLGIHPGGGHTWMMQRIAGMQTAMATVLFGEVLDGEQAERTGVAWRCVPDDELVSTAIKVASRAARAPRELAMRLKQTLLAMPRVTEHSQAIEAELDVQVWSMDQPEFAAKLSALQARISRS